MKTGIVLFVTKADILEDSKVDLDNVRGSGVGVRMADVVIYVDENGDSKILKNRYGKTS